ncbi:MAG: response regulator [Myxococcales bacterium]|nr:response regulator [Myxococcales bacterium]
MTRHEDGIVESVVVGTTSGLTAVDRARSGSAGAVRVVIVAAAGSAIEHVVATIGYRALVCAPTDEDVVAQVERMAPHVVLLDATATAAAAVMVRLVEQRVHPPIIAIERGPGARVDGDRWLAAGADDHLTIEQLNPAIVRRTIESAIARGRARELRARVGELDRLGAIATLAAGVAHEVNNPAAYVLMNLTTCREHVDDLRRDLGDEAAADGTPARIGAVLDEMTEMLDDNIRGLERIVAIVGALRAFARPDPDQIEPVDLVEVCREAHALVVSQLRHRARVALELAPVPAIDADPRKLAQVVINLLVNAADAIPAGEPDHEIALRVGARDGWVELAVADTGRTLSPEQHARVFEPFYAGRVGGAGGLGLATVRSVVERLGGKVVVISGPATGTEFVVRLPVRTGPAPVATTAVAVSSARRARVLIIDDEDALTRAMRRQLRGHHDVTIENDATAAMARLLREDHDVILCDVMMPGTDGLGFLEALRRARPELVRRLVLMTAGIADPIRELVLARGGQLIDKPIPLDALLDLIATVQRRA